MRAIELRLIAGLAVLGLCACAPKQRIPLDVAPHPATLYVNGERLDAIPPELVLRSDRAHVLYFKSEGYRPERVVLESTDTEGKPHLEPAVVQIRLQKAGTERGELTIEPEDFAPQEKH